MSTILGISLAHDSVLVSDFSSEALATVSTATGVAGLWTTLPLGLRPKGS